MLAEIIHTDSSLLQQLSKSDQHAFEVIYHRYWSPLLNATYKRLKDRHQSEDIVQNVFMALWNRREQLNVLNLSAYLHTAVRYEVLKLLSKSKTTLYFHSLLEEILLDNYSADTKIVTTEIMKLAFAYAQTLPKKRRNIFMLHLQNSLSARQIADNLQINQKTVQNQLRTALNGLHARIIPTLVILLSAL